MRLKRVAEACMWLPGFAPEELEPVIVGTQSALNEVRHRKVENHVSPIDVHHKAVWPQLDGEVFATLGGPVSKFEANVAAIECLRRLEAENREPTEAERTVLNRYTGWGGLPAAFNCQQFDEAWSKRANEIKALLTEEEYQSAESSTPNAHYTPIEVIQSMWAIVERMGFTGGRVLEPAAGVGYFLGAMPEQLARRSTVTGIELDQLSARIAKRLYGGFATQVHQCGFESLSLPENYFDLAIGNVPFGNYEVSELRNVAYARYSIHNYFFAKALEVVRPGGLVVFITSSYTMDSGGAGIRSYLASQANLVASIRLPNTAFKAIANTEVTTDILILQKRGPASLDKNPKWRDVIIAPRSSPIAGGEEVVCNEWFVSNPQWVIGKMSRVGGGWRRQMGCVFEGDLVAALAERIHHIPEAIYTPKRADPDPDQVVKLALAETHRPGYRMLDGRVYAITGSAGVLYKAPQKTLDRIAGMVEIRDAARKLIAAQPETDNEALLAAYRAALTVAYDKFVEKHGCLHARSNRMAFKADPDLPLLLSLEKWDDETQVAEKADIFFRRTVGVVKRVERCESAEEALIASLVERGRPIPSRIGELLGTPGDEAMAELERRGAVFLNPVNDRWESADAYLSGNVRRKLAEAKLAGSRFRGNVEALEAVIPADLDPHEIDARIGSTWIPMSDYEAFLNETFGGDSNVVRFSDVAGAWSVSTDWSSQKSVAATQTYGTSRVNAMDLFDHALNQTVPTVYDPSPFDDDKRVVNQTETIAAREQLQVLRGKFVEWLWADDSRAKRLVRLYNDTMNSTVARRYDGQHLTLPGFSQVYQLRSHQLDAVWRIVTSDRNALLAHVVGAGKTLTMICAGMELRRLGKAGKPMYVVPNHMLEQFAAEFLRAYPGANILMAGKEDLQGDRRRELMSRIATGDWDGVLVTHASFERLKMSDDFMKEYIQSEIETIEAAIRAANQDQTGNRIVKQLARAKKAWKTRLEKRSGTAKKDDVLTFEDLGIDWLFVDEAHYFKNLWRFSKMTRVAGLPNSNSERAFDMFVKTRHVTGKHSGRAGVVFATGTPVSNSMAEMWVMQRYLQPHTLRACGIGMFDTWAGNFGESVTALELSPDGRGYRMNTRFARFVNLPELMGIFNEVADIRTADMLKLPVPTCHKETVTAKATPGLKAYVARLVERAEAIRKGEVQPGEDNMLSVTNDGRKAALDMRLVDSGSFDYAGSKVSLCAEKVFAVWTSSSAFRGTQLAFCDLSTPQADGCFSVYQDLRTKLVGMGIPEAEIAFIHDFDGDAEKESLFRAVREGRIRILLGSTSKLGVGTNVQTRLVALHHLDAPWRPADVEQREGRIIRQGNLNEAVRIYRYVTEGSFDAYIWQTLETKARFIAQLMQGNTGMRSAEDVELAALSYAEVKALASGNPLVLEKAGVDSELVKLALLKSRWDKQQWTNKQEVATLPVTIARLEQRVNLIERDVASRPIVTGNRFVIAVKGVTYSTRDLAAAALSKAISQLPGVGTHAIGTFAGFSVLWQSTPSSRGLVLRGGVEYGVGRAETEAGLVRVLENAVAGMDLVLEEARERLCQQQKRLADLHSAINTPFHKADRLAWLKQRQMEIASALDLNKGEVGAVGSDESEDIAETA